MEVIAFGANGYAIGDIYGTKNERSAYHGGQYGNAPKQVSLL
jgi:hypothetical protein